MKKYLIVYIGTILLFFGFSNALAQVKDSTLPAQINAIFKKYDNRSGPGCAVAVLKNGKVLFKKEYGLANLEYGIPVTATTTFDIASVSKQFTGLAISMLVQEKKIALGEDIHRYLPQLPNFGKPISVEQLLWHTSGIRDSYDGLIAAGWRWNDVLSVDDMMKFILHQKELNFAPGSEFSYCNTEYILLQQLVEKVSGTSFAHYADSAIFKPIGMKATFFADNYSKIILHPANPYTPADHGFEKQEQQISGLPMFSTLDDLCKWTIHFNRMITAKNPVYTRMAEAGILNSGQKTDYGFGLMLSEDRGLKMIWHTGAWGGYRAVIKNYYTEGLSIIILSNGNDDAMNVGYSSKVADVFLKNKFREAPKIDATKLPEVKVDTALLKQYTGTYKFGPREIAITLENGQLMLQYTGEAKYPTKALSDSSFLVIVAGLPITFSKTPGGRVNTFTFRSILGKRAVPFRLTEEQLAAYTGTYYSTELFAEYTVDIQQGKLFIHHFRRGDFELSPDAPDQFSSDIGDLHFLTNKQHQVTGFTLSGERIRNLLFEKAKS